MRSCRSNNLTCVALALALVSPRHGEAQTVPARVPADKAIDVNPDAHLVLTFSAPPTIGKSGKKTHIGVFDTAEAAHAAYVAEARKLLRRIRIANTLQRKDCTR